MENPNLDIENFEVDSPPNKPKYSKKFVIILISGAVIFISLIVIVIIIIILKKDSEEKNNNQGNIYNSDIISGIADNYMKYLNKLAISDKRINHLFKIKDNNKDYFEDIKLLEKLILKITWEFINKINKEIVKELNVKISKFLSLPDIDTNNNISSHLFQIMIQNVSTPEFSDNINIKYIINKLNNNEEKEKFEDKLNTILLYTYINLPLQISYFSKNISIKNSFTEEIYNHMKLSSIFNNINPEMEEIDDSNSLYIYQALGTDQELEFQRITAKNPDIPYINICNTGIRTQYSEEEAYKYLISNIKDYYINPELKQHMKQCTGGSIMTDEIYNNFINDCANLINNMTYEGVIKIFGDYNFSIETANSVIEYLKLNASLDDIIIIRLGEKNNENKDIIYNKDKVYILFNVIDISESIYYIDNQQIVIKRATTEANVKAIFYLKNEYKNFLSKENYDKIILISSQGSAERQLECFNIVSNLLQYGIKFNSVIWNKNYEIELSDENISSILIDTIVKSYNLICKYLRELNLNEYSKNKNENLKEINIFTNEMNLYIDELK